MAFQLQRPAVKSRGWMTFTIADGNKLELGGATLTTPTDHLSVSNFLAAGIPQNADKNGFADVDNPNHANGHAIKHAVIEIVSAGATTPVGRTATDSSVPTTARGRQRSVGDMIEIWNCRLEVFNFKLFNRSGGNMVVEVEVFE